MDYIIMDIEFNGRKFASDLPMEVIEIGAVRLNSSLQQIDEFSALIKPVYFSKLNSFIKQKTGIPQEEIDLASSFPKVMNDFMVWLNQSDSHLFLTWGGEDLKRIIYDTRMHKLDDSFWMTVHYYDLLKGFVRYKKLKNDVSVESALIELEIVANGSAHRALDDARMTSDVFLKIFNELDFELKQQFKDSYTNAKERRLVKVAAQTMISQKITPTWELFVEHYIKDKLTITDPKKLEEMEMYFTAEIAKAPLPNTRTEKMVKQAETP
ncbi:exonuclease domain-containing protein [Paenibacillus psychroresistens]|uniref:Exonuclease domain-containing protein n=1 Tax=Paenibacillus psychroresistens TaxID=1778678 RepID=A0A6B8RVV4_9BACL|nr:3'-5' exonuclease [Paenibacillus psychroresistens]QGQ99268.1 exonuclease domain-containing protein [Paenibacillus psychroresistens]